MVYGCVVEVAGMRWQARGKRKENRIYWGPVWAHFYHGPSALVSYATFQSAVRTRQNGKDRDRPTRHQLEEASQHDWVEGPEKFGRTS